MHEINLKGTRIIIQNGLSSKISGLLGSGRFVLVTNPTVDKLFSLRLDAEKIIIPDTENSKSLETATLIYSKLIEKDISRDSTIVAFGGGVIGDLAGFVAATYMRGINLVHVPTTLLAQVDSSIGSKTGINHMGAKNIIGSFYRPKLVLIDPEFLGTLPEREYLSGMAEAVKCGLLHDRRLFEMIENNLDRIRKRDRKFMEDIIYRCCAIKAGIVSADEKEYGKRMLLNLGHTIGHAVESASNYKLKHGEAVSLGMIAAAGISPLAENEKERIRIVLESLGLPVKTRLNEREIMDFLKLDKKSRLDAGRKKINFVLLRSIGKSFVATISNGDVTKALKAIQ